MRYLNLTKEPPEKGKRFYGPIKKDD